MITLHHLENSRSQRILWLLEEIGADYEIKAYQRNPTTNLAPESLKTVHPLGKSPVITDGETCIAETGAIIEYLIRHYAPALKPEQEQALQQYSYWLHFGEGSMMPQLLLKLIFDRIKSTKMPFFAKPIAKKIADSVLDSFVGPNLRNDLSYIETHLSDHHWFCGEHLTGADFMMIFPLEAAISRGGGDKYPHVLAYVKRVQSLPTYQAGIKKGGAYRFSLQD